MQDGIDTGLPGDPEVSAYLDPAGERYSVALRWSF